MMRVIQKVSNPRGLVIGWLIGPEAALKAALPDYSVVGDIEAPLTVTSADLIQARKLAGVDVDCPITLIGFSAGCQSVRCALLANLCKDALANVGTFDGTHGSVPPAEWQLDVWRDLLAKAKAGKVGWITSCTEMTYTKTIPPGQPGRATPTREILETVLGAPLVEGSPVIGPGRLYAEVYPSTACDKPAHEHQGAVVMPALLGLCLGGAAWPTGAEVPPGPSTSPSAVLAAPLTSGPSLGERAVAWCEGELAAGVKEIPDGSNDSPRIREYFSLDFRRRATNEPLKIHSVPWCAAAQCFANNTVATGGEPYPALRVSGAEMVDDAIENGTWFPTGKRGDLAIFHRGTNPAGWERHVARVVSVDPLVTIAGNESNGWKVTEHGSAPVDLLGFISIG